MTRALVTLWVLTSVEVVDINGIVLVTCGKQVTAMTELNLLAVLLLDVLELVKGLRQHIHQENLIRSRNYHMETTWVECNSKRIFRKKVRDL
jgi:hypothetical protein